MAISVNGGGSSGTAAVLRNAGAFRNQRHSVRRRRAGAADHLHDDGARDGSSAFEVDVPKTKYVKDSAKELPVINITRDGDLYLNEKPVNINELGAILQNPVTAARRSTCAPTRAPRGTSSRR